jgi:hypothetical protein
MDPLNYEGLSLEDKMALGNMQLHPGFIVMKKLFEDACDQATASAIKLNPEDPQYETILKIRHLTARVTNEVCATLIKSIVMHSQAGQIEEQAKKIEEALKKATGDTVELESKYGSMKIKKSPERDEV